jgi:DNA-binding Lrp family transcriptional regulator
MVKAQSAPGTMISRQETAQKAAMELAAMEGSPSNIPDRRKISLTSPKVFLNTVALMPVGGRIYAMDAVARKILAVLQEDGRLTITELAARVGLSVSPCHRRLRELERSGAIRGYRAVVDADALGLGFEALVFVTMRQEDRETLLGFEAGVAAIPHVVQAQRLFGDPDYLLRVVTADLAAYQRLQDEKLSALPGVQRMTSTLVMKQVVTDRPLPA